MENKEVAIQKYMAILKCSREEAENIWKSDHEENGGNTPEQIELSEKAKQNKTTIRETSGKKKEAKPKERKVDLEKKEILNTIQTALQEQYCSTYKLDFVKTETQVQFWVNNHHYTLGLTRNKKLDNE